MMTSLMSHLPSQVTQLPYRSGSGALVPVLDLVWNTLGTGVSEGVEPSSRLPVGDSECVRERDHIEIVSIPMDLA